VIDQNVLTAKLAELEKRVRRVQRLRLSGAALYASDETAAELVSFNLMLAVQCASDLAAHLISDQDWGPVATAGDAFEELARRGVIPMALAAQLRKAVGFRNAVAHGYAQLHRDFLHAAATGGVDDLIEFSRLVATWVTQA